MQIRTPVTALVALVLAVACENTPSTQAPYVGGGDYGNDDGQALAGAGGGGDAAGRASAGAPATPPATASTADVVLASGAMFQSYLTDGTGRPLYMFANDAPGSSSSACSAACLDKWPVFDAKEISVGAGLAASDFSRFQRADGAWQTTFKGHPLYRFATDAAGGGVAGDGVGGRWYVARDYLAFVASKADLTPQGAAAPAPYMTNRVGRTVYVFMNDTKGTASTPPVSACVDRCLDAWPTWNAPTTLASLLLPSSMDTADFGQLERTVAGAAIKQLTYRGWPLYFHTPDVAAGETTGHLNGAWRAIDPTTFAAPRAAAAP